MKIRNAQIAFEIEFCEGENFSLVKIIAFIMEDLINELQTRTGYNEEEYTLLRKHLLNNQNKKTTLSWEQLMMLRQALNEVLHGIHISDYVAEFGLTEERMEGMFDEIDAILL